MVQNKGKRKLVTTLAVLTILLLVIGVIAWIKAAGQDKTDPYAAKDTTSTTTEPTDDSSSMDSPENTEMSTPEDSTNSTPTLDPATVGTVDIVPMTITASYVKGIGGFEYQVLRTTNGTRYVKLSSPELAGTKCTNDIGTFASILADPDSNESATLTKTTTVEGTKYGLSLEPATCTADAEKLQVYQKSFNDAFSLLKKME
jgi:hypothetical protein